MLTVFQLLLSLVTQHTEDDQQNPANEPAQDNQPDQTQGQAEDAEETNPYSSDSGRADVLNEAVIPVEEANEESDRSDAANPSPTVSRNWRDEAGSITVQRLRLKMAGVVETDGASSKTETSDVIG